MRLAGLSLAALGFATLLVAFLFLVLAREDLRQIERWEEPMVSRAEFVGDEEQVAGLRTVFEAEREKVRSERRAWIWVIAGSGAASVLGLGMGWIAPWALQSRTSNGFSRLG